MKIRSILDDKGEHLVVDYTVMSDGSYLCAIKGFCGPILKTRVGTELRNDLGVGVAKTRYYALGKAEEEFFKKYTAGDDNRIIEVEASSPKPFKVF